LGFFKTRNKDDEVVVVVVLISEESTLGKASDNIFTIHSIRFRSKESVMGNT
jgi:hypothetical protein